LLAVVWSLTLDAYVRARTRLWAVAGLWGGLLLIGTDVYFGVVTYIPQYRVRNDFRLMYGAALTGLHQGYSHLYDLAAQKQAVEGLGAGFYWSPFLNPPPLVWLVTPLTILPFTAALIVWTALLLAALALAWYLAAPGGRLTRAAHLAMLLGVFPVAFGVMVGQPVALVVAAVAACWWFAEHDRPVVAGVILSAVALKPQLALFVPLSLLVSGHARVFGAWLVATLVIALVALAMLGGDGFNRYREVLNLASQWEITRRYAFSGLVGTGPPLYVSEAIVAAVTLLAAWRHRGASAAMPIAAGIVGSLLFTPYVGFQDFAMLFVAGWLILRSKPSEWQVGALVIGFVLLELSLVLLPALILSVESLLLISLAWPAGFGGINLDRVAPPTAPGT
jgi:hypothetical protein